MIYKFNKKQYRDFKVFADNKLAPRSYFIPFGTEEGAVKATVLNRRYTSDKVDCLNGIWDFVYYCKPKDVPKVFDTDAVEFDRIKVPSVWQTLGYEPPYYTNVRYPFDVLPPAVPKNDYQGVYGDDVNGETYRCGKKQYNSVGVYRTFFDVADLNKRYILSFLGVASDLELYINGKYVGYSEGSHNTAEFLADGFVCEGKNELVAVVHKWCNGSYLEDQDMFRHNGIFRDVLLFKNDRTCISDFEALPIKVDDAYDLLINITILNYEGSRIRVALKDGNKTIVSKSVETAMSTATTLKSLNVKEWNAEEPKLYSLIITLYKDNKVVECVKKEIGFKTVEIKDRRFLVNGKPIIIKGVNHHDDSQKNGYYMTPEEIEKDVRLFKDFNINAVRTSHYPPDPMMLELCDKYGVYVIDEADIECHGTDTLTQISGRKKWISRYWDRVQRMYYRDHNSCSVIMWSLGNESGGIKCHDYCYDMLKKLSDLPIHYEGASNFGRCAYDVASRMYTSVDNVERVGRGDLKRGIGGHPKFKDACKEKPFFLCEYAHAMGAGPGSLEEYMNLFYTYDNLMGGCVWEFIDHAIYHEDKKYKYTYGGDHGEYRHDGNFCVDGLFMPDRTPHTSAYALKATYRPVRAEYLGRSIVRFKNHNDFRSSGYLTVKATLLSDGKVIGYYDLSGDIPVGGTQDFNLLLYDLSVDLLLNIDYYDKDKLVAAEQLGLDEKLVSFPIKNGVNIAANQTSEFVVVKFEGGHVKFAKDTGNLAEYVVNGKNYLSDKPLKVDNGGGLMYTDIFRAFTDNDIGGERYELKNYPYYKYKFVTGGVSFGISEEDEDRAFRLSANKVIVSRGGKPLFNVTDSYTLKPNGTLRVSTSLSKATNKPLPRLLKMGKTIEIAKEFDDIIYYGRGGLENYPDMKQQSRIGMYRSSVSDFMPTCYIRPQECGNRSDVRFSVIRNSAGEGFMVLAENEPYNLSFKPISSIDLASCKHIEDVKPSRCNYLSIDGFVAGLGSASCGAGTLPKYQLPSDRSYGMTFTIVPFGMVDDKNLIY